MSYLFSQPLPEEKTRYFLMEVRLMLTNTLFKFTLFATGVSQPSVYYLFMRLTALRRELLMEATSETFSHLKHNIEEKKKS